MYRKIKVLSPRKNPHICYISSEYREKIAAIKRVSKQSLYSILCTCAGRPLETQEQIKEFKQELRKDGYRNIGEWAEKTIDALYAEVTRDDSSD